MSRLLLVPILAGAVATPPPVTMTAEEAIANTKKILAAPETKCRSDGTARTDDDEIIVCGARSPYRTPEGLALEPPNWGRRASGELPTARTRPQPFCPQGGECGGVDLIGAVGWIASAVKELTGGND